MLSIGWKSTPGKNFSRSLYVFLTEKGGELAERIAVEFEKIEKVAMEGFSDKEKETLITLLSGIYRNICNNE